MADEVKQTQVGETTERADAVPAAPAAMGAGGIGPEAASATPTAAKPEPRASPGVSNGGGGGATSTPTAATVTLVSMDGDHFQVEAQVAMLSNLIKVMMDGSQDETQEIPLPNMHSRVLAKVIEFCNHHVIEPMNEIPRPIQYGRDVSHHVQPWYAEFLEGLEHEMLFDLILSANYLDIRPLLDMCTARVGLLIMNKTPDQIRELFNIKENFSPEIERKLRDENKWSTEPAVTN